MAYGRRKEEQSLRYFSCRGKRRKEEEEEEEEEEVVEEDEGCAVIRPTATKPALVRRRFEYVNITFDQLTPSRGRRTGNVLGGGYVSEQWVCGSSVTIFIIYCFINFLN